MDEFQEIILATMKDLISSKSKNGQKTAVVLINSLAMEIFKSLDQDKSGFIDWNEFKSYPQVDPEKQNKV